MARITIPATEDPNTFIQTKIGSPKLLASRNNAWYHQYLNDSTLTPQEREGLRMRAAHFLGCTTCMAYRPCTEEVPAEPPPLAQDMAQFTDRVIEEAFYQHVLDYRTWPGYSDRERLIIEFTERYFTDHVALAQDDEFWALLNSAFDDTELADLCQLVSVWEGGTKIYHLLGGIGAACTIS